MVKSKKINKVTVACTVLAVILAASVGVNIWQFLKLQEPCLIPECKCDSNVQIPENDLSWQAYIEINDNGIPGSTYNVRLDGRKVVMKIVHHTSAVGMSSTTDEVTYNLTAEQYDKVWEALVGLKLNSEIYQHRGYNFYLEDYDFDDSRSEFEVLCDLMLTLKMLGSENAEEIADAEKLLEILAEDVNLDL